MDWHIPTTTGQSTTVSLTTGEPLLIVGPNGSGKSALLQQFISSHPNENIKRITAYRQTWLESGSVDLTPARRKGLDDQIRNYERQAESLWKEGANYYGYGVQHSAILFDLVASENMRARAITRQVDEENIDGAKELSRSSVSALSQLNDLIRLGNLAVKIEISDDDTEILALHQNANAPFSISQMSDGERNAVLIAAQVLTVEDGTILLIDEPERHLHRSITEPFLSALFERRTDCTFVVSTHEIALPIAHPNAQVIITRSCQWNGNAPSSWDIDVLERDTDLPEDIKRSILGSRKRMLFIEGKQDSLDIRLYQQLFPDVTVIPIGTCDDVQRAVSGLRKTQSLNDVEAFGLIDRDNRTEENIEKLADDYVYVLDAYSVESLYYCSEAIRAVAKRQAETLNTDAEAMNASATTRALNVVGHQDVVERMAKKLCVRKIRSSLLSKVPDWNSIGASEDLAVTIPSSCDYKNELSHYQKLVAQRKLDIIVARYPIRESAAFGEIVKSLRFKDRKDYEKAVIALIRKDKELADAIKYRIEPLADALANSVPHLPISSA
ncbi:MAG: AAA family ATPase [Chloroflexi bacterium]|nr:AAA family ATPase [Chloroflexota bacterium]